MVLGVFRNCRGLAAAFLLVLLAAPAWADAFTERTFFGSDMGFKSIRFSPDGSADYYEACTESIDAFPVSPAGGTQVEVADDGFVRIDPGFSINFYGESFDAIYIGANGYVTLGFGDVESNGTLANHFNLPRISAFFTNLVPDHNTNISWKVVGTKVVITYRNIPHVSNVDADANFQIELYSGGGVIISWLEIPQVPVLIGISAGMGVPAGFTDSNLSNYNACASPCLTGYAEAANALAKIYQSPLVNLPPAEMDLDVNGIQDVANLRVLEQMIRRGDVFGHCQALSAWENNIVLIAQKVAVLPDSFFVHFTRDEFVRAGAGMATLGDGRFLQKILRLMGNTTSLGIERDEMDESAEPYVSWSGDPDRDGVCNRGEFIAAATANAFVTAALDPAITANGGECFDDLFSFPEGELSDEGEDEPDPDGPICTVEMTGAHVVPPNGSPYIGKVTFTRYEDQVLVQVVHNVPLPATVVVYRGNPGNQGVPFITLGSGTSPMIALISESAMDVISTGYYVQVVHSGPQGASLDIRGNLQCVPHTPEGEGAVDGEEGEGTLEGAIDGEEGEGAIEGGVDGEGSPAEGEGEGGLVLEGEPERFSACIADLNGSDSVPPFVTNFGGVASISHLGSEVQFFLFHNIPSPTFGAVHLGGPGEVGPKLFDIPGSLASPIVVSLPLERARDLSRGTYVRLGYAGFSNGEIRGNITCNVVEDNDEEGEVFEGEGEDFPRHSADYKLPAGVIELTELLRVVQFYNIGLEFGCADAETGYDVQSNDRDCAPADFDYAPQNWRLDLPELLRLIQFYNAGGYIVNDASEDGWDPQPAD